MHNFIGNQSILLEKWNILLTYVYYKNDKPSPNGEAAMLGPAGGAGLVVLASVDALFIF